MLDPPPAHLRGVGPGWPKHSRLGKVETALYEHPDVAEVAAVGTQP